MIRNVYTGRYMNVSRNDTGNGTWVIQWPFQRGGHGVVINEQFHIHLADATND